MVFGNACFPSHGFRITAVDEHHGDRTKAPIVISDILIGDVWLCSGQSNMTLYLKHLTNFPSVTDDIAKADLPLIRQGAVARQPSVDPVESRALSWTICTPDNVGMYGAAGFYFARQLQQKTGIPVGIILSSFGSTFLEEWVSKEALECDPVSKKRMEQQLQRCNQALAEHQESRTWHGAIKTKIRSWIFRQPSPDPAKILNKTATAHYNGMIRPLAPFPIKGVIWYQGEEEALEKDPTTIAGSSLFSLLTGELFGANLICHSSSSSCLSSTVGGGEN